LCGDEGRAAGSREPQVSPAYVVKLEQNLYLHERSADERHLLGYGDVTSDYISDSSPWPPLSDEDADWACHVVSKTSVARLASEAPGPLD